MKYSQLGLATFANLVFSACITSLFGSVVGSAVLAGGAFVVVIVDSVLRGWKDRG